MRTIAAVILAAGASTRFGQPKQLLDWQGQTLLAHISRVVLASAARPVVVVLGHQADLIGPTIISLPVIIANNLEWAKGLATSVRAGLEALPTDIAGALMVQSDQPGITPQLLNQLIVRFSVGDAAIVVPAYQGQRGSPALFARSLFEQLGSVRGDKGGRDIIARYAEHVAIVEVDDPKMLQDIDFPEDYINLQ